MHLDEETYFDSDTVAHICQFVRQQHYAVARGQQALPKIGQGVILYGKRRVTNWITTLADSLRVGDDYGRFRLQFEHGKAHFGMHGSFVVVNNASEARISFDHGPASSITEDAYFAMLAQEAGMEFGFINAFMYEQSPFTIPDFVRQRQRWFGGLWLCVLEPKISLRPRLIMGTFMLLWSVSWLCLLMVYANFLFPTSTPVWVAVCGGVSFLYYVTLYVVGFLRTYDRRQLGVRFYGLLAAQVLLIPLFSAMESMGVIYGLLFPPKSFYIVRKEG
jgi:egghead protein (zeste-white 4 protein)